MDYARWLSSALARLPGGFCVWSNMNEANKSPLVCANRPVCGDGFCSYLESCELCPQDCLPAGQQCCGGTAIPADANCCGILTAREASAIQAGFEQYPGRGTVSLKGGSCAAGFSCVAAGGDCAAGCCAADFSTCCAQQPP